MNSVGQKAQRAERDFQSAISELQECLRPETTARLGLVSFPDFDGTLPVTARAAQLELAIDSFVESLNDRHGGPKTKSRKVKEVMLRVFKSSHPFAKLLLNVGQTSSSVRRIAERLAYKLYRFLSSIPTDYSVQDWLLCSTYITTSSCTHGPRLRLS